MIVGSRSKIKNLKVATVGVVWTVFVALFYFGIIGSHFAGHIELSIIVAFALVFFSMHLFAILKKAVIEYL